MAGASQLTGITCTPSSLHLPKHPSPPPKWCSNPRPHPLPHAAVDAAVAHAAHIPVTAAAGGRRKPPSHPAPPSLSSSRKCAALHPRLGGLWQVGGRIKRQQPRGAPRWQGLVFGSGRGPFPLRSPLRSRCDPTCILFSRFPGFCRFFVSREIPALFPRYLTRFPQDWSQISPQFSQGTMAGTGGGGKGGGGPPSLEDFMKMSRGRRRPAPDPDLDGEEDEESERVQPTIEHPDIMVLCSTGPSCDAHPPSNVVLPAAHYTWQFRGECR